MTINNRILELKNELNQCPNIGKLIDILEGTEL